MSFTVTAVVGDGLGAFEHMSFSAEAAGRSIASLAAERDRRLVDLLELLSRNR